MQIQIMKSQVEHVPGVPTSFGQKFSKKSCWYILYFNKGYLKPFIFHHHTSRFGRYSVMGHCSHEKMHS